MDTPKPATCDLALCFQVAQNCISHIYRYGKAYSLPLSNNSGINSYDFSIHVEQWAAAVAGINGCICLNEVVIWSGTDYSPFGADDAGGHCLLQPERITNGDDPFSDLNFVRIADFNNRHNCWSV